MQPTTFERACAVVVGDPAAVDRINAIRRHADPAYPRWQPHINLFYPFLQHTLTTPAIMRSARAALTRIEPFTVTFDGVSHFEQKGGTCSCHLHPDSTSTAKLRSLHAALSGIFPDGRGGMFRPHLTIAVWPIPATFAKDVAPGADLDTLRQFEAWAFAQLATVKVAVTSVEIIDRSMQRGEAAAEGFRFKVQERLTLGAEASATGTGAVALRRRHEVSHGDVAGAIPRIRALLLDSAVARAARCLRRVGAQRKLPRTLEALESLLAPFSRQRLLVDPQHVWSLLTSRHAVTLGSDFRRTLIEPGKAVPPGAQLATNRGRGAAAVTSRGRGRGRGRGARPVGPPQPIAVMQKVVTVQLHPRQMATATATEATALEPFGPGLLRVLEARAGMFVKRVAKGHERRNALAAKHKSSVMPVEAFKRQLRDVCTLPCLVPVPDIIDRLTALRVLAVAPHGSLAVDVSYLPTTIRDPAATRTKAWSKAA